MQGVDLNPSAINSNQQTENKDAELKAILENTDKEVQIYNKDLALINKGNTASFSDLLALLAAIIATSEKLRSSVAQSKIDNAVTTQTLAVNLAATKEVNAKEKFVISAVTGTLNMALSTVSAVRIGQTKLVQDKHIAPAADGSSRGVKDLSTSELRDFSNNLQQARTSKYTSLSRLGDMSSKVADSANEAGYASKVRQEDELASTKELVGQFQSVLDQALNTLTQELVKLNDLLAAFVRATAATNR